MSLSITPKHAVIASFTQFQQHRLSWRAFLIALTIVAAISSILAHYFGVGSLCVSCLGVGAGICLIGAIASFCISSTKSQKKPAVISQTKINTALPSKKNAPDAQKGDSPEPIIELQNAKLTSDASLFWFQASDVMKEAAEKAWKIQQRKTNVTSDGLGFKATMIILYEVNSLLNSQQEQNSPEHRLSAYINLHKYNYFVANVILSFLRENNQNLYDLAIKNTDLFSIHPLLKQEMEKQTTSD